MQYLFSQIPTIQLCKVGSWRYILVASRNRDITTLSASRRDPRVLLRQATLAAAAPLWDKIASVEQLIWASMLWRYLGNCSIRCPSGLRKPWDDYDSALRHPKAWGKPTLHPQFSYFVCACGIRRNGQIPAEAAEPHHFRRRAANIGSGR